MSQRDPGTQSSVPTDTKSQVPGKRPGYKGKTVICCPYSVRRVFTEAKKYERTFQDHRARACETDEEHHLNCAVPATDAHYQEEIQRSQDRGQEIESSRGDCEMATVLWGPWNLPVRCPWGQYSKMRGRWACHVCWLVWVNLGSFGKGGNLN